MKTIGRFICLSLILAASGMIIINCAAKKSGGPPPPWLAADAPKSDELYSTAPAVPSTRSAIITSSGAPPTSGHGWTWQRTSMTTSSPSSPATQQPQGE